MLHTLIMSALTAAALYLSLLERYLNSLLKYLDLNLLIFPLPVGVFLQIRTLQVPDWLYPLRVLKSVIEESKSAA